MSLESVQNVIGKAAVDRTYRELLFSKPDEALKGLDLTPEETTSLKGLSREKFDAVSGELEERILAQTAGGAAATELNAAQLPAIQHFDLARIGHVANTN